MGRNSHLQLEMCFLPRSTFDSEPLNTLNLTFGPLMVPLASKDFEACAKNLDTAMKYET